MAPSFVPTFKNDTVLSIQHDTDTPFKGTVFTSYIQDDRETIKLKGLEKRLIRTEDGKNWELEHCGTRLGIAQVTTVNK